MLKKYETRWARLIADTPEGWTIQSDGILESHKCNGPQLEEMIDQLGMSGWILVTVVNHKATNKYPFMRDLFFRREIEDEN